jgi:hypothetical protein
MAPVCGVNSYIDLCLFAWHALRPEDRGSMFFRNVGGFLPNYLTLN